jgi:hypothetical protein
MCCIDRLNPPAVADIQNVTRMGDIQVLIELPKSKRPTTNVRNMRALFVILGTLILPFVMLALGAARNGSSTTLLAEPSLLLSNWLYMTAPHLLAIVIATLARPMRQHFLPWSLIGLSLTLVAFQCWVWWWVPPRESGLAWVIYIPLCAIVMVLVAVIVWWRRRLKLSSKQLVHGAA